MPDALSKRLIHAWNAFRNRDPTEEAPTLSFQDLGVATYTRPDRPFLRSTNERSMISSAYNQMALDVASRIMVHVKVDQNERYLETINSSLNYILTQEANIDQTSKAFMHDLVMSMFDEGVVAAVPVDTTVNPKITGAYEINTMRVGKILEWMPRHIRVSVYNDRTGRKEELLLPKTMVAIIENPLYAIMNEPNSTLKRLIRKLNILDAIDEQSGSGKLDLIIQLPYVIKSPARKLQAEERRKDIEVQLSGSKYGIAYTDGTERITQLNRPAENNLMSQITYLTSMLYSQLGITEDVFTGKANEATMLNYFNRSINVIVTAIIDEFKRKFLTKTARSQGQSIVFFKDIFSLIPAKDLAEIADKFTRNAILSSNEIRAAIGYKPDKNPKANELSNKNLNASTDPLAKEQPSDDAKKVEGDSKDEEI